MKPSAGLKRMLAAGVDPSRITFTSDGQGSLPDFDADGRLRGLDVGRVTSLLAEARDAVLADGVPLGTALGVVTRNPARALGLKRKGVLAEGLDADVVLLRKQDLSVDTVIARGRILMRAGRVEAKGTFEVMRLPSALAAGLLLFVGRDPDGPPGRPEGEPRPDRRRTSDPRPSWRSSSSSPAARRRASSSSRPPPSFPTRSTSTSGSSPPLGATNVAGLDVKGAPRRAERVPSSRRWIRRTGSSSPDGDQRRIVEALRETPVGRAIEERIRSGARRSAGPPPGPPA